MDNSNWRFGVVANITEYHIGSDGKEYRGTKAFTPGTKVCLAGKGWDCEHNDISVIGRNRFGRIVFESVPVCCLENIRTQRIFKPHVLEITDYLETVDGWHWWGRTSEDKKEAEDFAEALKSRIGHQ